MTKPKIEVLVTVLVSEAQINDLKTVSTRIRFSSFPVNQPNEIPGDVWKRTEILYTANIFPEPEQVPNLNWIQSHFAGIDHLLESRIGKTKGIAITSLSGAAASQSAEYALAMILALSRNMPHLAVLQQHKEWPRDRWLDYRPVEIRGSTVGLVGYGSVNRELARLLKGFGATILAAKRDARRPKDEGYTPEGLGDPNGDLFDRLYPFQALRPMLTLCDFVVIAVPLASHTRKLIGAEELQAMKTGSFLVNLSRGGILDESALLDALESKHLGGAALDVFDKEPLPESNPLWKAPNVIITPHIAGISSRYNERAVMMFKNNLMRYLENEPLLNLYDPERGY
jgi:phosphoglycerate dehydrogenase-like enzyme